SWAAAAGGGGAITAASNASTDTYSYGIGFSGELSGASVSADLMHAKVNADYDENHLGLSVGMAGFTVSGSYIDYNDLRGTVAADKAAQDGSTYELGVGYATGPYSVAVAYSKSKSTGDTSVAGDNTDNRWLVSAAYDLGAGVALTGNYFSNERNPEGAAASTNATDTFKVTGVVAGIAVSF
ncbi:MAG: porin, partial [Magnetovibrio sp.]|nr:porin [Magnetovibrio sp.]